jgi:hypothetical protein
MVPGHTERLGGLQLHPVMSRPEVLDLQADSPATYCADLQRAGT